MPTFCSKTQQRKKGQDFKGSFKSKVLLRLKGRITISVWSDRKAEKWFPFLLSERGVVCYPDKSLQILLPLSGYRRPGWMNSSKSIIFFSFAKLYLKTRKNASGRPWKEILLPDCCPSMLMVVQRKSGRRTLWTVVFADINILIKTNSRSNQPVKLVWVFWKF